MRQLYTRFVALDDIRIRSGGDGRTVEAYAAIFNTPAEVVDQDGHYREQINPSAFNKTLKERGGSIGVFYNHGKTIHGFPSDRFSMPLGTPLEIRTDNKGLLTVSRYNKTPLADEVLEAIHNGDIKGQSFSGLFVKSTPDVAPRSGYRRGRDGTLPLVTRNEIALREFGPTPFPNYDGAEIVGVRYQPILATMPDSTNLNGEPLHSEPDAPTAQAAGEEATEPRQHSERSLRDRIKAARIVRDI